MGKEGTEQWPHSLSSHLKSCHFGPGPRARQVLKTIDMLWSGGCQYIAHLYHIDNYLRPRKHPTEIKEERESRFPTLTVRWATQKRGCPSSILDMSSEA